MIRNGMDKVNAMRGAFIAVVERVVDQAVAAHQTVVDSPGVDPDAGKVRLGTDRLAQRVQGVPVELEDVPVQAIGYSHRFVGKSVDLRQGQYLGADLAEHHPAAGCPKVNRRHPSGTGHRRKAAATPASTGMCRPVVWLRSAEQSTKTALATFSGSTSRLSRVRCA